MRWLALFLALAGHAYAFGPPQPVLDLDFTRSDTVDGRITVTRADTTTGWNCAVPQVLVTFPANIAATHLCDRNGNALGLQVYPSTQFLNLWSNDLSQSAWIATNITPTPNQPGIDANGATLLTATADGGTILQPVTQNSRFRYLFAWVKAVAVTGKIEMTLDGSHWTQVQGSISTGAFSQVPVGGLLGAWPTGSIGFRMEKSGDRILVTYVNQENDNNLAGVAPSPPYLLTTNNFVIRPDDLITMNLSDIPGLNPNSFTVVIETIRPRWYGISPFGNGAGTWEIDDGISSANSVNGYYQSTGLTDKNNDFPIHVQVGPTTITQKSRCSHAGSSNQLSRLTNPFPGIVAVTATSFDIATGSGVTCNNGSGSGNEPEVVINGTTSFTAPLVRLVIGRNFFVGGSLAGYVKRLRIYPGRLRGGQQTAILSSLNPAVPPRREKYIAGNGGTGQLLFETGEPFQCTRC